MIERRLTATCFKFLDDFIRYPGILVITGCPCDDELALFVNAPEPRSYLRTTRKDPT